MDSVELFSASFTGKTLFAMETQGVRHIFRRQRFGKWLRLSAEK